jgi:Aminoglycoside-2''-adenylyltransferase
LHTFQPDLTAWDAWQPGELAARLRGTEVPWCVAGGWALSLFLGRRLRAHDDLELALPRERFDEVAARFPDCDFFVAGDGLLSPYPARGDEHHQTWARERATSRWRFDVFREPSDGAAWICRRDTRIRLPYDELIEETVGGIPYARPEVVLLFKAKAHRPKDGDDLEAVLPALPEQRRGLLAEWLALAYGGGHPWLSRLGAR